MKNKNLQKYVYVQKICTDDAICYIIGDESRKGGRDRLYKNGCKFSENKQLAKNEKLTSIEIKDFTISRDYDVHAILRKDFNNELIYDGNVDKGILHTKEAFYFKDKKEHDDRICEIVSKICTGEIDAYRRVEDWELRGYQKDTIAKCLNILATHNKVLIHLAMRGGKSIIALETARLFIEENYTKYKKILIITPFPSAIETFRNYTLKHIRMKGYNFYGNNEIPKNNDTQFVKLVSFQKDWTVKFAKSLGEYNIVIVDETHNTSASWRSMNEVLPKIKHKKEIHLSGTPFNDILSKRFNKDQIVQLDIIDLMKISRAYPEMQIYPENINVKDVCNMEELRKQLENYGKDDKEFMAWLNNNQMFSLKDIFENAVACMTFLKYISIDQRKCLNTPFYIDTQTENKYNHIIAYIPSVLGVKTAYKCLEQLTKTSESMFFGFKVKSLSKDDSNNNYDYDLKTLELEDKCNKFMDENEKTLILSCCRLTTGVTLNKLNTILNFKSISSAELFFQIMFRIMTYYPGKNEVNMFNYDSEYTIKIFKEFATVCQENINALTETDALREIFTCINYYAVLKGKSFEFEKVDPIKGYELFRKLPLSCSVNEVIKYQIDDFTDNEINILINSGFTSSDNNSSIVHKGKGGNSKLPNNNNHNSNTNNSNSDNKDNDKKLKKALTAILNEVAWIIIINEIKNVDELLKDCNIPEKVNIIDFKESYINKMIKAKKGHWQTYINDLNYKKDKNYLELVKNLPKLDDHTDRTTPEVLRSKMIGKVDLDKVTITDIRSGWKYCDPCCGRGFIIFDVVEYLVKNLGEKYRQEIMNAMYGIDINPHFVKLLNKLGYKNIKINDASISKNWFVDKYNKYMKFDCIIMNPPYSRNLHLQILREAIKHLKDEKSICVNLSPIRWLQDPLAKYKKNSDYYRFENSISKFCNKIELIKTEDARQLFNAEFLQPLAIYICDKKSTYNYYNEYFKRDPFIYKVFEKILSENIFEKHNCVKFSDDLKNFVLINNMAPPMKYGKPMFDAVKTWCGYFVNGKNNLGLTYRQAKEKNPNATRGSIEKDNAVIFNTEDEVKNCYNAMQTNFVKFFVMTSVVDVNVHHNVIPWMEDYTQPWDDARFYKYFGLTSEEQKVIEDTMAKYN